MPSQAHSGVPAALSLSPGCGDRQAAACRRHVSKYKRRARVFLPEDAGPLNIPGHSGSLIFGNKALAKKTELVMGSYTGDGGTQQIDLGFAARVVLVGHPTHTVIAFQGETVNRITVNETGFQVVYSENATVGINRSGTVYHYLAIP